ncbi:MAG: RNA polymerase subunit sigma-70 [Planctomycetota bacterium]|nr:MAG: RNA polymerase subunit sigma-70 [Planctomycetota bacterium]
MPALTRPPQTPSNTEPTIRSLGERSARIDRLRSMEIKFIDNPEFSDETQARQILREPLDALAVAESHAPQSMPAHLSRLCETTLIGPDEERRLFRRMNFLKYKAKQDVDRLTSGDAPSAILERTEAYLDEARAIRDHIVQGNMRLVMSIVKKFVTPQQSFDELLSEGTFTLMQAVEKFDYDRGFRFSTYAYRSITRAAYRRILDGNKESSRFVSGGSELVNELASDRPQSQARDRAKAQAHRILRELLPALDRREQFVIRSRYALGSHRKIRPFRYLAERLGISKERARQLERRGLSKLKKLAAEKHADDLVASAFE